MTGRRTLARGAALAGLILSAVAFAGLGIWQLDRRSWKHRLIAAVEARVDRPAVRAPGPEAWPRITAQDDQYRHVGASGHYLAGHDVRVRAVTDLGAGYWVMSPLDTGRFIVLVNRGFVPQRMTPPPPPTGPVALTGLLRITEPDGGFLRANDPSAGRWYSRDVAAISRAERLGRIAPYFIDARPSPGAARYPVAGLTVVRFSDNHLVYALTWFAMAGLTMWGAVRSATRPARRSGRSAMTA